MRTNYCTKLLKKQKTKSYGNLNPSQIYNNKKFWQTLEPFIKHYRRMQMESRLLKEEMSSNEFLINAVEILIFFYILLLNHLTT